MNNQAYDDTATRNPRKAYTDYENSTYTVVSKVAYLVGVQKRIFENEYEPPKMEWYEKLHADKNARIVRNLCMIRTALELNFKAINNRMRFDMCNLHSLPEYVPQDSLNELLQDGITIVRSRALPAQYIVDINKHISNRINNCKSLFPLWLKWEYVRKLFLIVKAKLFCPEIAGLFCRIAGLFCHDSRANLSLKPVCFGIAIS